MAQVDRVEHVLAHGHAQLGVAAPDRAQLDSEHLRGAVLGVQRFRDACGDVVSNCSLGGGLPVPHRLWLQSDGPGALRAPTVPRCAR